jgi:type IV pilus assembly protein PilE
MARGDPVNSRVRRARGFTLIEVLVVVAIVGILAAIAYPSYTEYVRRSSRQGAQAELMDMAGVQEKIFLNSNAYTTSVTGNYTGQSGGGLGIGSGRTKDGRYALTTTGGANYTLTATPVAGSTQANDGTLTLDSTGRRNWAHNGTNKPW